MSREDVLLKEYEVSQQQISSRGSYFWVSLNIIISVNLILLTQAAYNLIKTALHFSGHLNLLAIPILGVVMIYIDCVFIKWQMRQHYVTDIIHQRMLKIEDALGMHRNWLIHGRDLKEKHNEWKELPNTRKSFIEELLDRYPNLPKYKRPVGHIVFGHVLRILIILWFLLILLVCLIYFWPTFRVWLVN